MINFTNGYFNQGNYVPLTNIQKSIKDLIISERNIIFPNNTSYRIDDNNITLLYNEISYEFPTFQDKSLINLYIRRYEDLYSCCFNLPFLKVIKPLDSGEFIVGEIENNFNCENIYESDCLFFKRFYCKGLRDLIGSENINGINSNCSCYIFDSSERVLIKLGIPYSCINLNCKNFMNSSLNLIEDPNVMSKICNINICQNLISLKDVLVGNNIDINNINFKLNCL
jgi:hypothetical protein